MTSTAVDLAPPRPRASSTLDQEAFKHAVKFFDKIKEATPPARREYMDHYLADHGSRVRVLVAEIRAGLDNPSHLEEIRREAAAHELLNITRSMAAFFLGSKCAAKVSVKDLYCAAYYFSDRVTERGGWCGPHELTDP